MRILDRYIIRKFLLTFFFILGSIMLVAIVFDISQQLDDFIKRHAPLDAIIFDYYLNFALYYGNLFSPLLIFISVILFTAQMANRTEIVAILSSGISFRRLLVPYLISATLLAGASLYLNHWLLPNANETRLEFTLMYLKNPLKNLRQHIHKQTNPDEFIYLQRYNAPRQQGRNFSLEKWTDGQLTYKLMADFLKWDTASDQWMITNYQIRLIDGEKEELKTGSRIDTTLNFTPSDFLQRDYNTQKMDFKELNQFIEEERMRGSDLIPQYLIEKHTRTSYPIATYILTMIGAAIASRKIRGGIGLHLVMGILICVAYIYAMKITTVYATIAGLDPFLAVWLPNVLFGIGAVWLLFKAPK